MKINQTSTALRMLCLLALCFAGTLQAEVLVSFDMEAVDNADKAKASVTHTNISVSDLTGNNLNAPGSFTSSQVVGGAGDNYIAWSRNSGSAQTNAVGAIADGTFFNLTITPDAGHAVTLDSISFDAMAGTAGPSDRQFYLLSDKVGFNSADVLAAASTETGDPKMPYNTATADQNFSVDLSGNSTFSNITDSVTFRFYIATPTTFQNVGFDDITVNGTVETSTVIPPVVLVSYDMEETSGIDIKAPSFTNSAVTATSLAPAGSHIEQSGKLQLSGSADDYSTWRTVVDNGTDLNGAIDASAYFILSITPNAGKSITIDSLSFNAVAGTAGPSARSVYVMSSRSGAYTNGNELLTASTTSGDPLIPYNTATTDQNFEIDLSGNGAFSNITETVFFRFYIQTPGTHQNLAFDDITVNGFIGEAPIEVGDISLAVDGADSVIGWNAFDVANYSVQSNLNLTTDSWGTTHSNLTGVTGVMYATNSTTASACFYRVIIEE